MDKVQPPEKRKGIIQFPKDKMRSLEAACYGNSRIGRLLDYFIYGANLEAERHGLEESCKVVTLTRKQKDIFEKLNFNISRKTFIGYIHLLNEWGYVSSEPYGKVFTVNGEAIQTAIDNPPAEKSCNVVVKKQKVVDPEKVVLEEKVVILQQKVEVLEEKVVKLQLFVEEITTLQHGIPPAAESDEGHNFSPTSNYSNIRVITSSCSSEQTDETTASQSLQEHALPEKKEPPPHKQTEDASIPIADVTTEKRTNRSRKRNTEPLAQKPLPKLEEPYISEKGRTVWDVWLKMPWNKIAPPLTRVAVSHCETLATIDFSEDVLWKVINYARKNDNNGYYGGRAIQLGDVVREYPKWSNAQHTQGSGTQVEVVDMEADRERARIKNEQQLQLMRERRRKREEAKGVQQHG